MTNNHELKEELAALLEEKIQRKKYSKFFSLFPDKGKYRRELYPKHIAFANAGAKYSQRAFIAGNRVGKTVMGAFEMTCHLTGLYPDWWKGKRFSEPVDAWAASVSNTDTRDIIQQELLGSPRDLGSGMIPRELLLDTTPKSGIVEGKERIYVKHASGGTSCCTLKSYEQGRDKFQGTKKQVIWLDEEPKDYQIYSECLTRTMDDENPGIIFCTFTPLLSLSKLVLKFLPEGRFPPNGVNPEEPYMYVCQVSWEEVPHLDAEQKKQIAASYDKYEREARMTGRPAVGAGAIFPYPEHMVVMVPTAIPPWWRRACGVYLTWDRSVAVWVAFDPQNKKWMIYDEQSWQKESPAVVAHAIKQRGDWIPCYTILGKYKKEDANQLMDLYSEQGLHIYNCADKIESNIIDMKQKFQAGLLKVFEPLNDFLKEYRIFRRDNHQRIVDEDVHLIHAFRAVLTAGKEAFAELPDEDYESPQVLRQGDAITGY